MKFISTRLSAPILNFEDVIFQGLASDGGLYIPEFLPNFDEKTQRIEKNSLIKNYFLRSRAFLLIMKSPMMIIKNY